ncbi:MAG: 6-carboxytetrahydropterin synthase [Planctomycetaceae bacterium]|nr:6-carboxytetrahydropterin synthase [Planctomycetaceae bacterium]
MFSIRLNLPSLKFTALHGIRYGTGEYEPLHEHTFRVVAGISGPLNAAGYIVDFHVVEKSLREILDLLEKKTLLSEHELSFRNNCENPLILPIKNTTTELLAGFIAEGLRQKTNLNPDQYQITLELEESPGCWGANSP